MLTSSLAHRPCGEPLHCGPRQSAGRRRNVVFLVAALAALLLAAGLTSLAPGTAMAQTQQPAPPPLPQQPIQVQPGQQQPSQQQAPQRQAQPQAPAAPPPGQAHGDWLERCTPTPPPGASPPPPGKEACFLIQELVDQESGRPLLKITIGFFGDERQVAAVIATPLGVQLRNGILISVDGKEIDRVPYQVCEPNGCQAVLPMDNAAVSAFKAGNQAEAQIEVRGRERGLPISLRGFTAGFTAIQ